MKNILKGLGFGIFALAMVAVMMPTSASAALTTAALAITSDGALTITTAVGSATNLATTTTTGAVNIGTSMTTGDMTIGGAQTSGGIAIGGGVQTGTLTFGGGTGAQIVNLGTGGTGIKTINIGTGNVANVIVIGNSTAGTAAATTIHAGTGGLNIATTADARTIAIGTGAVAQTWNIGTGAAVQTMNIATGAAAHVVTIGAATTTSAVTIYGQRFPVVAPAGDATLTTSQSGSLISMNTAGEDITLPTVATSSGVTYRFVVPSAVATTAMTIITNGSENKIYGAVRAGAADGAVSGVNCTAASDTITLSISNETIGDWYELRSDGTNWYLTGSMADIAGMACTQAS